MTPKTYVETRRLVLREWCDADIDPWSLLNADPRVMQFFPNTYDRARSETSAAGMRERLKADGYGLWAVEVKGGLKFVGMIGLQSVPAEMPFAPAVEVGWRLAFEVWGRGFATEGARAALGFGFERLDRNEIVALTAATNFRSQRVMQKLAMSHDEAEDFEHPGLQPSHPLCKHVLYRLGRERFLADGCNAQSYTLR